MTLLVLCTISLLAFLAGVAVAAFHARLADPMPESLRVARRVGEIVGEHVAPRRLTRRLDPATATGFALTLALVATIVGGVVLGVLTLLLRRDTGLVEVDRSVSQWSFEHASPFALDVLHTLTWVGEPGTVVALAVVLAAVETYRSRSMWAAAFVLVVVGGNGVLTTTIKDLVDRVRPALDPAAAALGPSFPSGHSSWSVAFAAAVALLIGRGRSPRARMLLAGAAAAFAVAIAATRVLLNAHWLSDVIGGLALGLAWFAVCALAFGGRVLRFGAAARTARRAAEQAAGQPGGAGVA